MSMAIVLGLLTKGLHRAERQSRREHIAFLVYYGLVIVTAATAAGVAFAVRPRVWAPTPGYRMAADDGRADALDRGASMSGAACRPTL